MSAAVKPLARRKFLVLLVASLVSSLIMLDSNIVAVSLPSIARSLGATFTDIEWVVSAYILSFAALLLAAGSFADRHGRKRASLIGIFIFGLASAGCGFANSALMLNLARALQGIGASLLLTAALAIINHAFEGPERARAYAFWGACLGIAITSGPIIGGVLTSLFGWRWAFLVNLPLCIGLFFAVIAVVEESKDEEAKKLDLAGIGTFSVGLFLLIWALIDGNGIGWTNPRILLRLAGAAALIVAFVFIELRQARPMIDLTLFKRPTFLGSAFAMVGYAGGAQVMIFYLPLFLQNAYGFAPAQAGLAMIPFAVPMVLVPKFGVHLARLYSGRALLTAGLAIALVGDLVLCLLARGGFSYPSFAAGMLITGAGAGLLNGETAKIMQGAVPSQRAGMASGISATTRFIGLLLGVASLGAVLGQIASSRFIRSAVSLGLDPAIAHAAAKRVTSGDLAGMLAGLPPAMREPVHALAWSAFADGFAAASVLAAAIALATALFTYALVRSDETAPAKEGQSAALVAVME